MAPKFEQSALRTGSGPNSPSRLAPDPDLIKRVDPNEVRVGRQKNQNKYAPIGAYLELQSNEDVVGAAPTGDAPTTSELSTILLPT